MPQLWFKRKLMHKTIRPRENILANINCTIKKKNLLEWGILTKD